MTPTLPRPIEPGEIRVGDRVRVAWFDGNEAHTAEFTVVDRCVNSVRSEKHNWSTDDSSWTLLDRPAPAPAVGSRWRTAGGCEWVVGSDGSAICYIAGPASSYVIGDRVKRDPAVLLLSDATPIPDHGDGCSPWLWDKETDSAWVACLPGTAGRTHVQVAGQPTRLSWLDCGDGDAEFAARLVPWSERGQANG